MIQRIYSKALFLKENEFPSIAAKILKIMNIMREGEEFYIEESSGVLAALLVEIARLNRIVQKFFHETFHIYEKILPFTDRTQITVSRMSIIGWNHRKFSSRKPHFSLTKRHNSIPFVTETNLQIIMKMKIIHIISIILNPLLSQKSQDRTSGRHLVIADCHWYF